MLLLLHKILKGSRNIHGFDLIRADLFTLTSTSVSQKLTYDPNFYYEDCFKLFKAEKSMLSFCKLK